LAVSAVSDRSELGRPDTDEVADPVGESAARGAPIVERREHGADEQDESITVLLETPDGLAREVGQVAADLAHPRGAREPEAVEALDDRARHQHY